VEKYHNPRSYEAEFIQKLIKDKQITESNAFNLTFMYIDDVLSINNPNFANWIPLIAHVHYDISPLSRVKLKILTTRPTACGSNLRKVGGFFFRVLQFPPPIKLIAGI
jgi:hypothetical protein